MNEREKLTRKYQTARGNLLTMTIFSAVNVVLLIIDAGRSFLFSSYIPQVAYSYFAYGAPKSPLMGILIGLAFIGLLLLCYLLSKKEPAWMLCAAALFLIDTVFLFVWMQKAGLEVSSMLIDIAFHAWVLYYLVLGVHAASALRRLPEEDPVSPFETAERIEPTAEQSAAVDTLPIEPHDGKGRLLISEHYNGHTLEVYRKEPHTLLVIDGMVYGTWSGFAESRYSIAARIDGIPIVCTATSKGLDFRMRLFANGQLLGEKRRFI